MESLISLAVVAAGYLLGSLSFAVIVSRLMGLSDPRSYGSKNPGATNVLRSGNKAAAILTLLFDALKGALPVIAVRLWGEPWGLGTGTAAMAGFAAFVGHVWPVFFRFQGGKGVATAAGVLLAINPWLGLATLGAWLVVAMAFRYSSLASIAAALFAPFFEILTRGMGPVAGMALFMALLLVWRHEGNIRKLMAGQESRIGQKTAKPDVTNPPGQGPAASGARPPGNNKHGRGKSQRAAGRKVH